MGLEQAVPGFKELVPTAWWLLAFPWTAYEVQYRSKEKSRKRIISGRRAEAMGSLAMDWCSLLFGKQAIYRISKIPPAWKMPFYMAGYTKT